MATFTPSTSSAHGKAKWNVRFVAYPQALARHPTFAELSGNSVKLLHCILVDYTGNNYGHLTATVSRLKRFGLNSKASIAKAVRQLMNYGYLVRTRANVIREPALYAVTWFPIDRAPSGQPYDAGVVHGSEAPDLWRNGCAPAMAASA